MSIPALRRSLRWRHLTVNFSRGRFVFGMGTSHIEQLSDEHGLPRQQPLQRIADVVEVTHRLQEMSQLVGVSLPTVKIREFRPSFSPNDLRFPIYLAAIGEKMLELASRDRMARFSSWRSTRTTSADSGTPIRFLTLLAYSTAPLGRIRPLAERLSRARARAIHCLQTTGPISKLNSRPLVFRARQLTTFLQLWISMQSWP